MSMAAQPDPQILESKLRRPWVRPGIVSRTALVDRLLASHRVPVVSVVAPAFYGKTTLLAQWAERRGRTAWVSLDERDNDPETLLACVAAALDRVEAIDPKLLRTRWLRGSAIAATAVTRLAGAMSAMAEPVALILDHLELVSNQECRDAVAELALHLPAGSQLAIATRGVPPLPMARLRVAGHVVEIGASDLAMDASEARGLLEAVGVGLADADQGQLIERTEGWPVGLYLAALAINAGGPQRNAGLRFSGDDRLMADYLQSELLSRLSKDQVSFLTRTSVLERMCGPLCDAMLGAAGSAAMLESLERSNLLLVALDRRGEWYRYHHLLRDLLGAELRRREPEIVPQLHRGAAAWYEANGLGELAIDHARKAGDSDRVARLVLGVMQPVWASGRVDTVLRWMEWLEQRHLTERYPAVAVHGALIFALLGRPARTEWWAAAAERASPPGRLPDGSTMASYLAYLRALLCRDGVQGMRRDAQIGWEGLSPLSPYRATMLYTEGLSHLLEGDLERADPDPRPCLRRRDRHGRGAAGRRRPRRAMQHRRRPWRLAGGGHPGGAGAGDRAGRGVRRLLDQRPGLRLGGPGRDTSRQPRRGTRVHRPSRPPAPAAHLRAPGRVGPGPAGAGAGVHRTHRPRRRAGRPQAGARHPPAATRPRPAAS